LDDDESEDPLPPLLLPLPPLPFLDDDESEDPLPPLLLPPPCFFAANAKFMLLLPVTKVAADNDDRTVSTSNIKIIFLAC
jgi:hypothetical protein